MFNVSDGHRIRKRPEMTFYKRSFSVVWSWLHGTICNTSMYIQYKHILENIINI